MGAWMATGAECQREIFAFDLQRLTKQRRQLQGGTDMKMSWVTAFWKFPSYQESKTGTKNTQRKQTDEWVIDEQRQMIFTAGRERASYKPSTTLTSGPACLSYPWSFINFWQMASWFTNSEYRSDQQLSSIQAVANCFGLERNSTPPRFLNTIVVVLCSLLIQEKRWTGHFDPFTKRKVLDLNVELNMY